VIAWKAAVEDVILFKKTSNMNNNNLQGLTLVGQNDPNYIISIYELQMNDIIKEQGYVSKVFEHRIEQSTFSYLLSVDAFDCGGSKVMPSLNSLNRILETAWVFFYEQHLKNRVVYLRN